MTTGAPVIVVVGGVAGGASAATRARRMNDRARIVLFEKSPDVSLAVCGLPYRVGGEIEDSAKLRVARPELLRRRFRIDVRTRHEALSIDRAAKLVEVRDLAADRVFTQRYDKLILAPGATPVTPPIPGVAARGVFTLRTADDAERMIAALASARRAVVAGGGFVGLEVAEQLRRRGLDVALVEAAPHVLPPLDAEMAAPLHRELARRGIRLELGRCLVAVEEKGGAAVGARLSDGTRIPADVVVLGLGVRPAVGLAVAAGIALGASGAIATDAAMRTSDPDVYAVGDAAEVAYGPTGARARIPLAGPANRAGRLAGEHAATGAAAPAPAVWGAAIVRVFDLAAGVVGLSLSAARAAGLDARAAHVVALHHAGYFPGAKPLTLKLVYENPTGRVLGAQAVGEAGADKRLDVVSAVMHHRGSVHDLAQIDLTYSPPFGSAKDPLHLAAFVAENDLAGIARLVPPDHDLAGVQVVDVREPDEVARMPLARAGGVRNVPLDELRGRMSELDAAAPTIVACRSGLRAHVAVRMLAQNGFRDVRNLSGGALVRDLALNPWPEPSEARPSPNEES